MRERDLHKLIRENKSGDNIALANALRKKHPELTQNANVSKDTQSKKPIAKRVAIFAPLAAAAVLAIVLIPTLLLNNDNPTEGPIDNNRPKRNYVSTQIDSTVKEYNDANNTNFLYFDWTNVSDYTVKQYRHNKTDEFLGLGISLSNSETEDDIEYVICSDDYSFDFLEYNISICTNESTVSDCSVKWSSVNNNSYGIFHWGDYDYYMTLKNNNESRLFELIEILLLSQD